MAFPCLSLEWFQLGLETVRRTDEEICCFILEATTFHMYDVDLLLANELVSHFVWFQQSTASLDKGDLHTIVCSMQRPLEFSVSKPSRHEKMPT